MSGFPGFLTGVKLADDRLSGDWPVITRQEHVEEARRLMNGDGGALFELSAVRLSRSDLSLNEACARAGWSGVRTYKVDNAKPELFRSGIAYRDFTPADHGAVNDNSPAAAEPNGHDIANGAEPKPEIVGPAAAARPTALETALRLARAGLKVTPAKEDKKPLLYDWENEATTDERKLRKDFANPKAVAVALPMGPNRLVAIDCDVKEVDGIKAFEDLVDELREGGADIPPLKSCPQTRTPSGGKHYLFQQPEGVELDNSRGALPKGIDVRGHGGQVIAVGSHYPTKGTYRSKGHPTLPRHFVPAQSRRCRKRSSILSAPSADANARREKRRIGSASSKS
jgi:hypothetical protein